MIRSKFVFLQRLAKVSELCAAWQHEDLLVESGGAGTIGAVDCRMLSKEAIDIFRVLLAMLKRWLRWREQIGSAIPKRTSGGMRRRVGASARERCAKDGGSL